VDAEEAERHGLVNAVFEPEDLLGKVMEVAALLASKSPVALAAAKTATNRALAGDHRANLDAEASEFGELFASEDAKEGMTAFVEKREPTFVGR
jgi:enoyl-CoA hydratase/carnithine racemase